MALGFHNTAKDMTFVEDGTHRIVLATELAPGKTYRVFFVLQNSAATEEPQTHVMIQHGESEESIGLDPALTQPVAVTVPAALNGYPGLAAVEFTFTVPQTQSGVIVATVLPAGRAMLQRWSAQKAATVLHFRRTSTNEPIRVAQ